MAQDYKNRTIKTGEGSKRHAPRANKRKPAPRRAKSTAEQGHVSAWRWILALGLIALFAYFLYSLSSTSQDDSPKTVTTPLPRKITKPEPKKAVKKVTPARKQAAKQDIQYDFYTILPQAEFVIPDYEVKTRKREERVGKAKAGVKYSVQAGAFRQHKDADSLKAKLIMMGFSPKIEKALIGSVTWYRVKMGPYNRLASVDAIQSRLKSNKMDALVIEVKN